MEIFLFVSRCVHLDIFYVFMQRVVAIQMYYSCIIYIYINTDFQILTAGLTSISLFCDVLVWNFIAYSISIVLSYPFYPE